jgi:hypothetical protein
MLAALLLLVQSSERPAVVISAPPLPATSGASELRCNVLIRDGSTAKIEATFDHAARALSFRSSDPRLPLGDRPVPLRIYASYSSLEGGVETDGKWLNFETLPLAANVKITQIEFRLETSPPDQWSGELNSLYGFAICDVAHSGNLK